MEKCQAGPSRGKTSDGATVRFAHWGLSGGAFVSAIVKVRIVSQVANA
jgi:hypothetical protein